MNRKLADCCIVCLEKKSVTISLNESHEKVTTLSAFTKIEFSNYIKYSHLLCTQCDERLTASYSFLQQILKSIQILEENEIEFDKKASSQKKETSVVIVKAERPYEENDTNPTEDPLHNIIRRTPTSSIKTVPIEDVNEAIEAFRKARGKCDNCLICGFTVTQRKYLIKHMAGHHTDQVPHWCRECNGIFQNMEEHRKTHSRKFPCTFCGKLFRANAYVEHIMCHAGAFKCDLCSNMFNSASSLKKHKYLHTKYRPHRCPNCLKGFLQASALRYHLSNIHGKLKCENCTKHFHKKGDLSRHECVLPDPSQKVQSALKIVSEDTSHSEPLKDTSHSDIILKPDEEVVEKISEGPVSPDDRGSSKESDGNSEDSVDLSKRIDDFLEYCDKCDKKIKNLERHVANYHSKLMCKLCQREFRNSYKLQLHIQIHNGTVPNECRYCQKKFHHKVKLLEHERTHTKEKPFKCNFCEKSFTQKSVLNTHMKQHTGRPEVCDICGKRFCRKSELRLHLSKHTGEKPHLCSICGKNFGQKSHLNQHMISHGEDRPHQCPFCDKAFKRNELLKGHLRLHSGNKPFSCSYCAYTCYRQYRLREHMKIHSGQIESTSEATDVQIIC